MEYRIQSSHPGYDASDREAVDRVLRNNYTAEGPKSRQLIDSLCSYVGRDTGSVASSGTTAFHLLLEALGVNSSDEVILPSYTCQSLLHPIHQVGATPRLADVDPTTCSLTSETVKPLINDCTALIVLVHAFGYPVDDTELFNLGVPVLEDIAQAIGSTLPDGKHVGGRGRATMGSLYATKQLSGGSGGFVLTDDTELAGRVDDLKTYDEREDCGPAFNYSLSDLNAALALNQLTKHDETLEHQSKLAKRYDNRLESIESVSVPDRPDGHSLYRYVISVPEPDAVIEGMQDQKIEVKRPVYNPLHDFLDTEVKPVTQSLHESLVLLPLHPAITESKVDIVIDAIQGFYT